MEKFSRVKSLLGQEKLDKLKNSSVAIFGVGGVGGYTAEALIRSGVGSITVFDNDTVALSNINRQIISSVNVVGKDKVEVMKERLLSINPDANVKAIKAFYLPENADNYPLDEFDYIVDAIDTVSAKIELIKRAKEIGVPIISCMGTGGKLDISALKVADIEKTKGCPLARVMRRELKNRNIKGVKVVYSEEQCTLLSEEVGDTQIKSNGRVAPASMIFVPATAGLMLAKEVVIDLTKGEKV